MLGTSKVKHDKEGFELFITTAPIPDLNEKLNVFGRVIKGEDVVQVIITIHSFSISVPFFTSAMWMVCSIRNSSPLPNIETLYVHLDV